MDYKGSGESTKGDKVTVFCANDSTMESKASDILNLNQLPAEARTCYKFSNKDISSPLFSVSKCTNNNCIVHFWTNNTVTINQGNTGRTLLTGKQENNLYTINIPTSQKEPVSAINTATNSSTKCAIHRATSAYTIKGMTALIQFLHATVGYPPKDVGSKVFSKDTTLDGLA